MHTGWKLVTKKYGQDKRHDNFLTQLRHLVTKGKQNRIHQMKIRYYGKRIY